MARTFHPSIVASLCVALLVFAFVAAPHSCEWGLNAYAVAGFAFVVALFALPFFQRDAVPRVRRIMAGAGLSALGVAVWVAGLFLANVRILCRLF